MRIRRQEMFVFRKTWRVLFCYYLRFNIHPFDLFPMTNINGWSKVSVEYMQVPPLVL